MYVTVSKVIGSSWKAKKKNPIFMTLLVRLFVNHESNKLLIILHVCGTVIEVIGS